ncbi:sulfatase family protein [Galbibacter mesophilus]|uniref:sulfatase family protein n=1 Tax=Galbibacter mesophilus TaxID=379069 RepID=UPI00191DBB97|nr:sulfatase [Galbibacter mesophilus]MCM5663873.1 sulfatase [Galbibacter mesophilus]
MTRIIVALLFTVVFIGCKSEEKKEDQNNTETPNILLITVDDMSQSSVGVYGNSVENITPNIDQLAKEGFRFEHAFVNYSICNPSRSTILTGLYAHNHGSFAENGIKPNVVPITRFLKEKGYQTGIMHKEFHYQPMESFAWDEVISNDSIQGSRVPKLFKKYAKKFMVSAKEKGKPFILVANTADPHRPFATRDKNKYPGGTGEPFEVTKLYDSSEVEMPPFLPNHPAIKYDEALYQTSVHRADEMVGAALEALEEAKLSSNTIVVFISDNGKAFPKAKHDCYVESNATPLILRWPEKIKKGTDTEHMVTSLDIFPTLLEYLGMEETPKFDGKSFKSIIDGEKQTDRNAVFSEYEYHTARSGEVLPYSSRSVQTKDFRYIVNFWADGKKSIEPVIRYSQAYEVVANSEEKNVEEFREFYFYRTPEELYNVKDDPACTQNLIDNPEYASEIKKLKALLLEELKRTNDPSAKAFEEGTPDAFARYIEKMTKKGKEIKEAQLHKPT